MKIINKLTINLRKDSYIYSGTFDVSDIGKIVTLNEIGLQVNVESLIINSLKLKEFLVSDLLEICKSLKIKSTIYPITDDSFSFRKLDSSKDELKSCYLSLQSAESKDYLVCVAFDETQPTIYKAELMGIFLVEL